MSKNNRLRNATPERRNYKLYKAKKQWITACATFLLTFGATAVMNVSAQADTNENSSEPIEVEEVGSSTSTSSSANSAVIGGSSASGVSSTKADSTATSSSADESAIASTSSSTAGSSSAAKPVVKSASTAGSSSAAKPAVKSASTAGSSSAAKPAVKSTSTAGSSSVAKPAVKSASTAGSSSAAKSAVKSTSTARSSSAAKSAVKSASTAGSSSAAKPAVKSASTTATSSTAAEDKAKSATSATDSKVNNAKSAATSDGGETTSASAATDEAKVNTAKQGAVEGVDQAKIPLTNLSVDESTSKYNVNDWQYTTSADGITLTGYTGQGTDYYIPNAKAFRDAGKISAGQKVFLTYDFIQTLVNTDKATSISIERAADADDKVVAVGYADGSAHQFNSAFAPNQRDHNNNIDQGSNGNQTLKSLDLAGLDVSNITDMSTLFANDKALESVTGLDTWEFSPDMHSAGHMFAFDPNLKTIQGIKNWDTSNFKYIDNLVNGDTSLTELDLSGWKTDNVIFANNMFDGASALTSVGDLSNWRLNNATTTADMFNGATALNGLGNLDNWGLGKDTNMSGMFRGTSSLTDIGDIHGWDVSNVQRMDNMFNGTAISNFNISGWHFNSSMKDSTGDTDDYGDDIFGTTGMFANLAKPTEIIANDLSGTLSGFSAANFYGDQPLIVISNSKVLQKMNNVNNPDNPEGEPGYDGAGGHGHDANKVYYVKLKNDWDAIASQQQDFVFDSQEDLDKYLDNLTTGKNYKTAAEETASNPDPNVPDDAVLPLLPTKGTTIPTDLDKIVGTYVIGYTIVYQFVDDDDENQQIGKSITIQGNMGQTIDLSRQFNLPAGYVLDDKVQDNTIPSGSYTFNPENLNQLLKKVGSAYDPSSHKSIPVKIHLKHKTINVPHDNPVKPGDKTPIGKEIGEGAYESDLNQTITRTINVTEPGRATTTTTQTATIYRDATVDEVTGKVLKKAYTPWSTDTTDWKAVDVPTYAGYTAVIKQIVTNSDGTTTETTVDSIPNVVVDGTTKSTTINVTYTANDQSITYNFVDDDEKVEGQPKSVSSITESGQTGQTINFTLTVPANYQLANGQTLPTSYKFKAENNNPVTIHLVHKTEDVSDTDPKAKETRTLTVNYVDASTGRAMQNLTPAQLQVFYKRSAIKDLVTGEVTYGNWQWDKSQGDKDNPGYKVISGNWTLPQEWNPVEVATPDVPGFTKFTTGDWEKNKDGGVSTNPVPANEFTFPTYGGTSTTITGANSTAYTPDAPVYEATATHTVYYVPIQEEGRVITEHYKKYNADGSYEDANVVEMPDGTKQSYAQIKVWYQKKASAFATNGSTDSSKWTISYGGWEWNKNAGDQDTPGFTVVSGGYLFNNPKCQFKLEKC